MLRIGLVDDEPEFLGQAKKLLQDYFMDKGLLCHIDVYSKPELLYYNITEGKRYDVCFLDIEMPGMNGRELAEKIREWDENINLIFLTLHTEYIKMGYRVRAFDFISKDEIKNELSGLIERLLRKMEKDATKFYTVSTYCRYEKLAYNDIIFIYKNGQNIRFVLKNGEVQERKSLKKVLNELDGEIFMLIERGYIVNLAHIVKLHAREVELSNGKTLMVSREHIQNVRNRLGMYCMRAMSDLEG